MNKRSSRQFMSLMSVLIIVCLCVSCTSLMFGPEPDDTPCSVFEILWGEFDALYSGFERRKINWDSLYTIYRPQVHDGITSRELFSILSQMTNELKDGHVNVYSQYGFSGYDRMTHYTDNFPGLPFIVSNYLDNIHRSNRFTYGSIHNTIGYIHIDSFTGTLSEFGRIGDILYGFKNTDGIIIDLRSNRGGHTDNVHYVAGHFITKRLLGSYFRYRNGPRHSDFGDFRPLYVEPQSSDLYDRPIVLLSSRMCYSATEGFIITMQNLPNVTVIGDTTGGGTGIPILRELPNGWTFRLPVALHYSTNKITYEGVGIPPDKTVFLREEEKVSLGKDTIIEAAIKLIKHHYD